MSAMDKDLFTAIEEWNLEKVEKLVRKGADISEYKNLKHSTQG